MAEPATALADAISKVRESVAVSRKAVNKWIVGDRRVPKADLVGHLILTDRLLAALREQAPAPTALHQLEELGAQTPLAPFVRQPAPAPPAPAEVADALRRADEVLSWLKFEYGVPVEWPEQAVIASCRARIDRALLGYPAPADQRGALRRCETKGGPDAR